MARQKGIGGLPSAEEVRRRLDYDPETGIFRWKWRNDVRACDNSRKAGKIAGSSSGSHGYTSIDFAPHGPLLAHRLAFVWMTGEWPFHQTDHIDGTRTNNRWANLREATKAQNMQNVGLRSNNTSGINCVIPHKKSGRWRVVVTANGKVHHGGYFDTIEEAKAARDAVARRLHGKFARTD